MLSTQQQQQQKDVEIRDGPTDTITSLQWSPQADFLAASSWDNNTRVWEVNPSTGDSQAKTMISHDAPALCCAWSRDGTKLFSGSADKGGKLLDLASGQTLNFPGMHSEAIKSCRFVDGAGGMTPCLATGSWDKTVKYWDLRQQSPVATLSMPERIYDMDVVFPLMVVATAERNLCLVNLHNPAQIVKTIPSPLKWQTRCVAAFPNGSGYAVGSIEGRVGIAYVDEKDQGNNFSFKCHRDTNNNVFSVNAISFHPVYGTFSTAGSDGTFNFWDKDSKQRLKQFANTGAPITATAFSRNGSLFSYATGYDWSKGHEHYTPQVQQSSTKIYLLSPKDEDVKPRPPKPKLGGR